MMSATRVKKKPARQNSSDYYFSPTIPGGKDKPKTSRASRAGKEASKVVEESSKLIDNYSRMRNRRKKQEDLSSMSDDDLRRVINRANLERQYRDVMAQKQTRRRGLDTANDILKITGNVLAIGVSAVTIYETLHKFK